MKKYMLVNVLVVALTSAACVGPLKPTPIADEGAEIAGVAGRISYLRPVVDSSSMGVDLKKNLFATLDKAQEEVDEAKRLLSIAGSAELPKERIDKLIYSANWRCDAVQAVMQNL